MAARYQFNRMELAGALGDLGTILPLGIGMIVINGLDPLALFACVGIYYLFSGFYFGVTMPVEPMKVIGAYAIATGIAAPQIFAATLINGLFLFVVGVTGAMTLIGKYTPKPVIRGVQLSTGVLLVSQGVKMMLGSSQFQVIRRAAEPYLSLQHLGPLPIGILIGVVLGFLTLLLLDNRRLPAALVVVVIGVFLGLILGTHEGLDKLVLGVNIPRLLPTGIPPWADFATSLFVLALPQLPMTIGNSVIATGDLAKEYFGESSKKVTYPAICMSLATANIMSFFFGGMPMCHGAGGLASRFRFGARTAGSNIISGFLFLLLALLLGSHALSVVYLIPMSALGVLLVFAGSQLALTILDLKGRKDLFVPLMMVGITLASNLAVGFIAGIALAYALKSEKLTI
ncbi:MAG: sulfate permease [Deltaproteobacteria bacterium]|nr:sulfate permease [Deltaproteobacteria bacterium]